MIELSADVARPQPGAAEMKIHSQLEMARAAAPDSRGLTGDPPPSDGRGASARVAWRLRHWAVQKIRAALRGLEDTMDGGRGRAAMIASALASGSNSPLLILHALDVA